MIIPIGVAHLTKKKKEDSKISLRKFYIEKIWRRSGYEQKSLLAIVKHSFRYLNASKVYISAYKENEYYIQFLKEVGFKFNKTTTKNGDPEQRFIFFIYKDDLERNVKNNSIERVIKKNFYFK